MKQLHILHATGYKYTQTTSQHSDEREGLLLLSLNLSSSISLLRAPI